ncbi:OmpA family protein [Hankyongella ginsenosidimutans]|uniref:OmpA family protein n=1 Tax=Hankyongella ginsenosidimutans TaxID=1763828 RepID=UPI001CA363BC|nr:OmpA family protein [Hankyongella ginsenosidimutans]
MITGYTDNVGGFDANVMLSKRRADAVVAALVRDYRIQPARLTGFGAGMTGPRAPNTDEAGRAKNRRVELAPR